MLASVQEELGDSVVFLSLTIEEKDTKEDVEAWLKKAKASTLMSAKASSDATKKLRAMAGIEGSNIPASVFINAEGQVVGGHTGVPTKDDLMKSAKTIS